MRPSSAASTARGNSRQTDFRQNPSQRIVLSATCCCLCLSPPRHGSNLLKISDAYMVYRDVETPQFIVSRRACMLFPAFDRRGSGGLVELAVERGAANFEAARHFGHLAAVVRDREADDLVLHLFQRPHFACRGEHG